MDVAGWVCVERDPVLLWRHETLEHRDHLGWQFLPWVEANASAASACVRVVNIGEALGV